MQDAKIVDVEQTEEPKKECSSCKKGLTKYHWGLFVFSCYLLAAAVKGTIIWVKEIINLF